MGVNRRGQAVMVVVGRGFFAAAKVLGGHHTAGGHDAQLRVEVRTAVDHRLVQAFGQVLGAIHPNVHADRTLGCRV